MRVLFQKWLGPSIFLSLLLHLSVILGLHISPYINKEVIPVGIDVQYIPEETKVSVISPKQTKQSKVAIQKTRRHKKIAHKRSVSSQSSKTVTFGKSSGTQVSAENRYYYDFFKFIEGHMSFPYKAKRLRQTGTVLVSLLLHRQGQITDVKVIQSCPYEELNKAALKLVQNLPQFKSFPMIIAKDTLRLEVPIRYVLN